MFRKLSFASNNVNSKEKAKSLKQTNLTSKSLSSAPDDDLDDVAVISNTNPDQVTYGYGASYGSRGSITAINGPKVVPGIIIQKSTPHEPSLFAKGVPISKSQQQYSASIFNTTHVHAKEHKLSIESTTNRSSDNRTEEEENDDDQCELDDIEQRISNRIEQKRLDSINQASKQAPSASLNQMANSRQAPVEIRRPPAEEQEEQSDLETLEHDSRQDEQSELESDTNDELDDDENDKEEKELEIYDEINDLDKDYSRVLETRFTKNDYYLLSSGQRQPIITPTSKFMNSLSSQAANAKTIAQYKSSQLPLNPLLPHYIASSNHVIHSGANSDKLSNYADNPHLLKKTNELRKSEIKREYQRLDNQVYTMHSQSPSQNTSSNLNHSNHLNTNEKSGCNLSFVFDPSGRLCYYWELIVSLAFVYNFWVIIYRFSFAEISDKTMTKWLTIDTLADFIYLIDIGVHFRTAYLDEGVLQTDTKKLRQHYMNSTMFYIDCLCLLPSDILYLSMGFNSILRCFRLVKFYRFLSWLDRTERHSNSPNIFRTIVLTHHILIIFHWNASVYNIFSKRRVFGQTDWFSGYKACEEEFCDYLHAFYWSTLALTLTGDLPKPKTRVEYLFLIVELVFGLLLVSVVLGHVSNIVTNVSAARKEFQARLDAVKTFMRIRRVPEHLKIKVIKWFDYLWMTKKSSDDECVGFLPAKLKAEIAIHVHLDTLKRVEIFRNTEAGFLCALVLRLKPILFSPGDYVCRKGEIGKEMYIVSKGKLQVVEDGGKIVLATLRAGSYFGEISILNMGTAGNRRTASVRSVGYSDLFCLSKQDLWQVLKDYPAARLRLEAIASKRLKKYRKQPCSSKSHNRFHNNSKHSGEELEMSTNKSRNEDLLLNQTLRANSRIGESAYPSRAYKQPQEHHPFAGNQFASMLNQQFTTPSAYPTHIHPLQPQPHLFHYSQLNAQELELNKQLNNQPINLQPALMIAGSMKPIDLTIAPGATSLTPNKPIVTNLTAQKSATLLYGLPNLQSVRPQQMPQHVASPVPAGAPMTNLNKMHQLAFDHRAASALDASKPLKIADTMESYSLNSYGQSISNQQLQQPAASLQSNLYFINNEIDQLNRMNPPRSLSPNRSPLYLVHSNCRTGELDSALQQCTRTNQTPTNALPQQQQPQQQPQQQSKQSNLQSNLPPTAASQIAATTKGSTEDQAKNLIKKDENQLLLEIRQLKENLKKVENEKHTLTAKLSRGALGQASIERDKVDRAESEQSDRKEQIDLRTAERERTDVAERGDRNDKLDRADRSKEVKQRTVDSAGDQAALKTALVDCGRAKASRTEPKLAGQLSVNQRPSETRLDIEDDEPNSFEDDRSERNKETII